MSFNQDNLQVLVDGVLQDLGGAYSVALVRMGERLGLYAALHQGGPATAATLAERTGLAARYVREWAAHQAASGYLAYDAATEQFELRPEQAQLFADQEGPLYMVAAFDHALSLIENQPLVERAFKTGRGVAWKDQASCMFCSVAKFFRPGYEHNLVQSWLPAIDGLVDKLERGARVADVGCGHGYSTQIMATAFPRSEFLGIDFHEGSIAAAREHAASYDFGDRLRFEVMDAAAFGDGPFDLITSFDCLHDMGDPAGVARHVRSQLAPDGVWMIVEPIAGDRLEDNLNPVGRLYYAGSTMVCLPTALAQPGGMALGGQAGEKKLREVIEPAAFASVERVAEGPFNMILAARAG